MVEGALVLLALTSKLIDGFTGQVSQVPTMRDFSARHIIAIATYKFVIFNFQFKKRPFYLKTVAFLISDF